MQNLNILHINTQLKSSSATIPYRIHEGYIDLGYNSMFLTADCDDVNKYKNVIELPKQKLPVTIARGIRNIWYGKVRGNDEYYYFPQKSYRTITKRRIVKSVTTKPDIIIAYWTNFYFTQDLLCFISSYYKVPIILYLMDEEPYTGGCHMTFGCENFKNGCGNCKALKFSHKYDISYRSFKRKEKWINNTEMIVLAATSFSYSNLEKSPLFKKKSQELIYLPIDNNIFKPEDKNTIRTKLNLPHDKKIILFGGASFERKNKGMKYLIEALRILYNSIDDTEEVHILIVGNGDIKSLIPFSYTHLGYLNSQEKMAEAYQACDVFVCPTIQDAGPAMINESIMSGRPVVSFDTGVAKDLIINYETGYIARSKDSNDLALGLKIFTDYTDDKLNSIEKACRDKGLEKCEFNSQLNKIINLVLRKDGK